MINNHPCSQRNETKRKEQDFCCSIIGPLFNRSNHKVVMTLMKYSLDLTDPWIPHYYNSNGNNKGQSTLLSRDLYKTWLAKENNEFKRLVSKGVNNNILQGWRCV